MTPWLLLDPCIFLWLDVPLPPFIEKKMTHMKCDDIHKPNIDNLRIGYILKKLLRNGMFHQNHNHHSRLSPNLYYGTGFTTLFRSNPHHVQIYDHEIPVKSIVFNWKIAQFFRTKQVWSRKCKKPHHLIDVIKCGVHPNIMNKHVCSLNMFKTNHWSATRWWFNVDMEHTIFLIGTSIRACSTEIFDSLH